MARPKSKRITAVEQETFDAVCAHVDAAGYPPDSPEDLKFRPDSIG